MADLDCSPGSGPRGRGQIILVAAFALAVTFVALAVVVNSAIYTENLASRGETAGTDDALYLRYEAAGAVGDVIEFANVYNTSNLAGTVESGVANVSVAVERQAATSGAYVNLSLSGGPVSGVRVAQNESSARAFTSANHDEDWTVVTDVTPTASYDNNTRAFDLAVEKSSLASGRSGAFTVVVDEWKATSTWEMRLYRDATNPDEIVVEVTRGDGSTKACRTVVNDATVELSVTRGRVDGEPCYALRESGQPGDTNFSDFRYGTGVGTHYNVSFANGDAAAGNYSFVANRPSIGSSSTLNTSGSRDSPYVTDAVYEVTLGFVYESPSAWYETDVRVAPGEPR